MNIFKQLYKSSYSTRDISTFRFQGIGKTILFVFLLALITTIPTGIIMSNQIHQGVDLIDSALEQPDFPSFHIENGTLYSDNEEPYISELNNFVFILDGSGSVTLDEIDNYEHSFALLTDEMVLTTFYQAEAIEYRMFEGITLSGDDISSFIGSLKSLLPIIIPIMFLIIYLFTSAILFIQVSILAIIGLLIKKLLDVNLKYRHTWILSTYSLTIPTLFFAIMELLHIQVPFGALLNWAISTIILFLVLKEIPSKKAE